MGDPIFDGMQEAPVAAANQLVPPAADWWFWRRKHPRIYVARSGEDGAQEDWMRLLKEVGPNRMDQAYIDVCRKILAESRVSIAGMLTQLEIETGMPTPQTVAVPALRRRWHDESWGHIVDLCINPETYMKMRYGSTDPERLAKAKALAKEIKGWFPKARNNIELADLVLANPERVTQLIDRRLIAPKPAHVQPPR